MTEQLTADPAPVTTVDQPAPRRPNVVRAMLVRQETTLVIVIVLIGIALQIRNPTFTSKANLLNILQTAVIYFIPACGAAPLMIGGGLDFSVGYVFTVGGLVTAWALVHGVVWPLAILLGLAAGGLAGAINDLIISRLHVPPIIATLGTFFILEGLAVQISGGTDILPLPHAFTQLGETKVLGVPITIAYAVVVGLAVWFMLEKTRFGVNVRALGGNRDAAIANGLHVRRLDFALYTLAGLTAALAGIIFAAQVGAGQVEAGGADQTLGVITVVLIGGVSLFGGLGSITGVAIGAILIYEIQDGIIIANIPAQYNTMVTGAILIFAVAFDHVRRQRLYRR